MSAHKRLKMSKKAKGGKAVNKYNAAGSPEVSEAENTKEGFKHGGHTKKKDGGHAEGKKSHARLDKAKRGGKMKKHAMGGSPFTAAAKRSPYSNTGAGDGHQKDGPKGEDSQNDTE